MDDRLRHGVSSATVSTEKTRLGGPDGSEAKRLKALEGEKGRLKRMLADAMFDNAALKRPKTGHQMRQDHRQISWLCPCRILPALDQNIYPQYLFQNHKCKMNVILSIKFGRDI